VPRLSPLSSDFTLDHLFTTETEKSTQCALFHLVTVLLPEPEEPMYLVDSNYDVTFGGQLYTRFPLKWAPAEQNDDGSISKSAMTIANVDRVFMYYLDAYNGLRNCRVSVKTVYANALDYIYTPLADGTVSITSNLPADGGTANDKAYIEDEGLIDTYTATEQTISFQLDPVIDLDIRLPRRRYMVDSCYWKYGDADTCKVNRTSYPELCPKTFAGCKARNNEHNFGGFPGISGSRRILL